MSDAPAAAARASSLGLPAMSGQAAGRAARVVVHAFELDRAAAHDRAFASLDAVERARCERFVFARDRLRYACTRHALRRVVAAHCDTAPDALRFATGRHGRPHLVDPPRTIDFNVSHAGAWIAIAVSPEALVGIDVDVVSRFDSDELCDAMLGDPERERFLRSTGPRRARRLSAWWCAKEAFVKLNGVGLSLDPKAVDVAWETDRHGTAGALAAAALPVPHACVTAVDVGADTTCVVATAAAPRIELRIEAW